MKYIIFIYLKALKATLTFIYKVKAISSKS